LLVVIGIIGILIGLVFTAGAIALQGAKERATADVIRTLDAAMQVYLEERAALNQLDPIHLAFNPSNAVDGPADPYDGDDDFVELCFPIVDARIGTTATDPIIDSVGLWMGDAQRFPRVKAILDRIPQKFISLWDMDLQAPPPTRPWSVSETLPPENEGNYPVLTTVLDAWGRPIRLVLPQTDGLWTNPRTYTNGQGGIVNIVQGNPPEVLPMVPNPDDLPYSQLRSVRTGALDYTYRYEEIRRNWADLDPNPTGPVLTDSDGGRCEGSRPYFYSAGPDNLVGIKRRGTETINYNTDNVYTAKPRFPRVPN
jgi:type II secretory pathway pseudopilin PulG